MKSFDLIGCYLLPPPIADSPSFSKAASTRGVSEKKKFLKKLQNTKKIIHEKFCDSATLFYTPDPGPLILGSTKFQPSNGRIHLFHFYFISARGAVPPESCFNCFSDFKNQKKWFSLNLY